MLGCVFRHVCCMCMKPAFNDHKHPHPDPHHPTTPHTHATGGSGSGGAGGGGGPLPDSPAAKAALVAAAIQSLSQTACMDCPPHLVGLLIGKKGWTIKKIQSETGAQISINQAVKDDSPRKIYITGASVCMYGWQPPPRLTDTRTNPSPIALTKPPNDNNIIGKPRKNRREGLGGEGGQDDQGGALLPGPRRAGTSLFVYTSMDIICVCIFFWVYIQACSSQATHQ